MAVAPAARGRLHDPYIWHKLHSASGIFPIGFFLAQHLLANSYALRGAGAYDAVIRVYGGLPFVAVLEVILIYIPILYHSIYGIWISMYGQANLGKYSYGRNWMYFMQRVSGIIAFFYIGIHVWDTSIHKYIALWQGNPHPDTAISYLAMSHQMANPLLFWIQAIGIVATVFSFHERSLELLYPLGTDDLGPGAAHEPVRLLGPLLRLRRHGPLDNRASAGGWLEPYRHRLAYCRCNAALGTYPAQVPALPKGQALVPGKSR